MASSLFRAARGWIAIAWHNSVRLLGLVRADRRLLAFILVLLAVDLTAIAFFGVAKALYLGGFDSRLYDIKALRITMERGYPELFNYAQTLLAVCLLGRLAHTRRQPIYAALAVVFGVALLDDSLAIHETGGGLFVAALGLQPVLGLRDQDVGELMTWAILGALVIPVLLVGLARSERHDVEIGAAFLLVFGVLLFCAIVVDVLYTNTWDLFPGAGILSDMIEDGGEMLTITATCALALGANLEPRAAAPARSGPAAR